MCLAKLGGGLCTVLALLPILGLRDAALGDLFGCLFSGLPGYLPLCWLLNRFLCCFLFCFCHFLSSFVLLIKTMEI